jgi:hypothetical protein
MGFFADKFKSFFSGSSSAQPTQSQVNQASDQIEGMVENRDLLQDKAPVQVNSKFSDFLERNKRADGSYNSAAQAIIDQYDDGRSNYQVAMEGIKNSPGGKQAFKKAFPNPLVKIAEGVGNYIQGGGILGILPNLLSNVNEKVGGIFNQDKAPTDMGTTISSMDQADLDALKGPSMADISGPGTAATGFDNEADAIAAYNAENPNFPALNMGITNPELMNASSLLNFEDLLNYNANDVKDIINSFKDNQGFDVQDNQLQYNLDAGPGKFQFGIGPNSAGINFNLPFGA